MDLIKAYVQLTPAHYKAITDAAHGHHLRVHAHVYAEEDTRNALENGVDVLTHVGSAGTAPPYSPKLIRDIVNAGRPQFIKRSANRIRPRSVLLLSSPGGAAAKLPESRL